MLKQLAVSLNFTAVTIEVWVGGRLLLVIVKQLQPRQTVSGRLCSDGEEEMCLELLSIQVTLSHPPSGDGLGEVKIIALISNV